jgi:arginine utilization regulatory protein
MGVESKFLQHTLQEILQLVDVGIHVVDATGVTVLYNPAAAKIEGLDPAQVMGRHILDVYPSLNPESSTLLQVSRTLQPLLQKQQSFTNFKGNRITTVNSTRPIVADGRLIGAVEVSQDITNVRELSERLVDLQARMFDRSPKKSTTPTAR